MALERRRTPASPQSSPNSHSISTVPAWGRFAGVFLLISIIQPYSNAFPADGPLAESPATPRASPPEDEQNLHQLDPSSVWSPWPPEEPRKLALTGRRQVRAIQDQRWHEQGSVVRPFARVMEDQHNVTTGPLAYGRIRASYTDVDKSHEAVRHILDALHQYEAGQRRAREESRRKKARQGAKPAETVGTKREEGNLQEGRAAGDCVDGDGEAGTCPSPQTDAPPKSEPEDDRVWRAVRVTKLDLDLIQDTPLGQQMLYEIRAQRKQDAVETRRDPPPVITQWVKTQTGVVIYLTLQRNATRPSPALTSAPSVADPTWQSRPLSAVEVRRVAVSIDHRGYFSIMQDTRTSPSPSRAAPASLRVLSFNVWNTNPPHYLYPQPEDRWARYIKRMRHLARVIHDSGADIIGLQEVRYDERVGPLSYHSQVTHVLDLLREAAGESQLPEYQYVYQPAMAFSEGTTTRSIQHLRDEEGLAILSRYPILESDYLLLPRDFSDEEDGHQRACLHALIDVPGLGPVDVYSTHWTLSETMRDDSTAAAVLRYMDAHRSEASSRPQILLGDLNAEPHERSLEILKRGFAGSTEEVGGATDGGLVDAWLEHYAEPQRDSKDEWERREALTFPCCNPVKRVDYVLYRNGSTEGGGRGIYCVRVKLVGQEATADTKDIKSEGGGMLDHDSPVWASDHRGVLAEFNISDTSGRVAGEGAEGRSDGHASRAVHEEL